MSGNVMDSLNTKLIQTFFIFRDMLVCIFLRRKNLPGGRLHSPPDSAIGAFFSRLGKHESGSEEN